MRGLPWPISGGQPEAYVPCCNIGTWTPAFKLGKHSMQPLPPQPVHPFGTPDLHASSRPPRVFGEEPANEVERLADEIDGLLSGHGPAVRRSTSIAARGAGPLAVPPTLAWEDASRSRGPAAAEQVGSWLGRAKRERRFQTLRSIVSWAVALGFAFGIVTIAGLLLSGNMPYLDDIARVTRTFGL